MRLTSETIKRIRHNKYSVDCIQGMCTLSDGDIIANLCDTIEALQQENERLKALADVDPETLSVLIRQYVNENDDKLSPDAQQLKQQLIDAMRDYRNPADVEALKQAKEGEWLPHTNVTSKCSICGGLYSRHNYCPNCGAKMNREAAEKAIAEVGE